MQNLASWRRFLLGEDGSAPFFLIWFCVIAFVAGIGLDTANAWRHKQILQQTADVAAHSGTVALAEGASDAEVIERVKSSIEMHLSPASYGKVLSGPEDIQILDYDPQIDLLESTGDLRNAVAVTLHRNDSVDNPVNLLLLRIGSIFWMGKDGLSPWQIRARSIAIVAPTALCDTSDMIHAAGSIDLTSNQFFGSGYCVHSQTSVWLPSGTRFAEGSSLSMPDLEACKNKCSDSANPGAGAASREVNMPVPDLEEHISKVESSLLSGTGKVHNDFFMGRPVSGDTGALVDAGILHPSPHSGEVVRISSKDFNSLDTYPSGLVYDVSCQGKYPDRLESKKGKGSNKGGQLDLDGEFIDLAIVSDCTASFGPSASMKGAMLVLSDSNSDISAHAHTTIGDPTGGCVDRERTMVFSRGGLKAPAGFAASNISLVLRGSMHLAGSGGSSVHRGFSVITEGSIHTSSGHTFRSCNKNPANQPTGRVIRHIGERTLPGR